MEKDIHTFFSKARSESLSSSEKDETRRFLVAYAEAMPVRDPAPKRQVSRGMSAIFLTRKYMPVFGILLAASLAFGGVSFAAEQALPGDALYTVKVDVNEEVRSALTVSPKAKAEWEARRVERRMEEAEQLAAKAKLDAGARADLEQRLAVHTGRVNKQVDTMETDNDFESASDLSSRLEGSLAAHHDILVRIGSTVEADIKSELDALETTLDNHTAVAGEARAKDERSFTSRSDDRLKNSAQAKMEVTGRLIAETHDVLAGETNGNAEAGTQARARLQAADEAYAEGRTELSAGNYGQAFVLFQRAQRGAREAKLLIRAEGRASDRQRKNKGREVKVKDKTDIEVKVDADVNVDVGAQERVKADEGRNDDNNDRRDTRGEGEGKVRLDLGL